MHGEAVCGLSEAESKPLMKFLCEHSITPRFVYRHYWSVGDLVMRDTRCLVHLAVNDYDPREVRHMIRTTSMGEHYGRLADPNSVTSIAPPISAGAMAANALYD